MPLARWQSRAVFGPQVSNPCSPGLVASCHLSVVQSWTAGTRRVSPCRNPAAVVMLRVSQGPSHCLLLGFWHMLAGLMAFSGTPQPPLLSLLLRVRAALLSLRLLPLGPKPFRGSVSHPNHWVPEQGLPQSGGSGGFRAGRCPVVTAVGDRAANLAWKTGQGLVVLGVFSHTTLGSRGHPLAQGRGGRPGAGSPLLI